MKAAIYERYGSPDVIRIADVEKPVPKDDEVLIQVRAASVNPVDWHFLRGLPYFFRMLAGLRKPKFTGLGLDVAGQVEALGRNATRFKPGDAVFGSGRGAFAEYACAPESQLTLKPDNVTFEQAASAPVAALSALKGLRDSGHLLPDHKVLINGAAGGVGTFAVQIAKSFGALVTAVCSTRNVELILSLGADRIVDYTQEDFTKSAQRYDVILDCIGNHSLSACRLLLNPAGSFIAVGGPSGRMMFGFMARGLAAPMWFRMLGRNFVLFRLKATQADLNILSELLKTGKISPVIDKRYTLSELPEAIRYVETGRARGKVVITLAAH